MEGERGGHRRSGEACMHGGREEEREGRREAGETESHRQTHKGGSWERGRGHGIRDAEHAYALPHVAARCLRLSVVLSCCQRERGAERGGRQGGRDRSREGVTERRLATSPGMGAKAAASGPGAARCLCACSVSGTCTVRAAVVVETPYELFKKKGSIFVDQPLACCSEGGRFWGSVFWTPLFSLRRLGERKPAVARRVSTGSRSPALKKPRRALHRRDHRAID